ncbi:hypothetical protein E8E11_005667 [Didymella keratinophila]|nr:hypothetical protein E8E11_005667 [Didymella keratinophila]
MRNNHNISSRSYSFHWGEGFSDPPRDGSVVFGGYDEAVRDNSRSVTLPFNRSDPSLCPEGLVVTLTAMNLRSEVGAAANIFDGLGPLDACIVPSMSNIMALPKDYGDKLLASMGAVRADHDRNGELGGMLQNTAVIEPQSASFRGNLSVSLEDKVAIEFTAQQILINGMPYVDNNGLVQRNDSLTNVPIVVIYPNPAKREMPRLGSMFFSSAYLMVNHDRDEFTITAADRSSVEPAIVGIDTEGDCSAFLNGTRVLETLSGPRDNASIPNSSERSSDTKLTTGAIAGIIVGVSMGLLLVAVNFCFWRRRKSERQPEAPVGALYLAEKDISEVIEAPVVEPAQEAGINERHHVVELDGRDRLNEMPAHG